jgi:hypothetical protein
MSQEQNNELSKSHAEELSKYTYFLLATSATAITYALEKLEGLKFSPSLLPVIIAVALWTMSFYCGIRHIKILRDHMAINAKCLAADASNEAILEKLDPLDLKAEQASKYQFRCIAIGGAFYVIWRFAEMYNIS